MKGKKALILMLAAAALLGAACGGGDSGSGAGGGHEHSGSDDGHSHSEDAGYAFGEPADPSAADRTITVTGIDELKFEPVEIEVEVGETIAFEFRNAGDLPHEFVLGDDEALDAHAHGGDQPNGTGEVPGGGIETIAWTFSEAGELAYECHVDNHHEAGMRGTITVR